MKNKIFEILTLITFMETLKRNLNLYFMLMGAILFYNIMNSNNFFSSITNKILIFLIFPLFLSVFLYNETLEKKTNNLN